MEEGNEAAVDPAVESFRPLSSVMEHLAQVSAVSKSADNRSTTTTEAIAAPSAPNGSASPDESPHSQNDSNNSSCIDGDSSSSKPVNNVDNTDDSIVEPSAEEKVASDVKPVSTEVTSSDTNDRTSHPSEAVIESKAQDDGNDIFTEDKKAETRVEGNNDLSTITASSNSPEEVKEEAAKSQEEEDPSTTSSSSSSTPLEKSTKPQEEVKEGQGSHSSSEKSSKPLLVSEVKPKIAVKRKRITLADATKEKKAPVRESKRSRIPVTQFQSPHPDLHHIMKGMKEESPPKKRPQSTPSTEKSSDAVFFRGEHLAVRNTDGGFFICQAIQNIFKTSKKIKIQWLSETTDDKNVYIPEYYDKTDFETILTSVEMERVNKKHFKLTPEESSRIQNILKRAVQKEEGKLEDETAELTEDNPDGLDISLYQDEDQLKELEKKKRLEERKATKKSKPKKTPSETTTAKKRSVKRMKSSKTTPFKKRSVKAPQRSPVTSKGPVNSKKRKAAYNYDQDEEDFEIMPTPKKRKPLDTKQPSTTPDKQSAATAKSNKTGVTKPSGKRDPPPPPNNKKPADTTKDKPVSSVESRRGSRPSRK